MLERPQRVLGLKPRLQIVDRDEPMLAVDDRAPVMTSEADRQILERGLAESPVLELGGERAWFEVGRRRQQLRAWRSMRIGVFSRDVWRAPWADVQGRPCIA
jgi:hypothetical protein